jgi:nitroreductase
MKRRSIRKFTKEEVPEDSLRKILEAGIWAPSGSNAQPWRFVLVRKCIDKVRMFSPGLFGEPSALIVICSDRERAERGEEPLSMDLATFMDIGAAAQNMMLRAYELGIGSCPVRSFNQKAVQKLLDLPEDKIPELIITLGYPDEKPPAPHRRSFQQTVYERN